MKKNISVLFYISIGLLPFGMTFRILHWPGGNVLFTFGLLGMLIYFTSHTIKDIVKKRNNSVNISLQILIAFMSVILFSKYLYHFFGDYPGLLIVPLFIIMSLMYLIKSKIKDSRLTIASIAFLILSVPLFGLDFHKAPRHYIPYDWYNRYDVENEVKIVLPYEFQFKETEELSNKAFDLRKSERFSEAIQVYRQAMKLEPQNLRLFFDISYCYAEDNDLETAKSILDSAIIIDSTNANFYCNRGLLYYKLKENHKAISDYERAIQIDSTNSIFYANLALVYYDENLYDKSCKSISKAESIGLDNAANNELNWIKNKICK